MPEQLKESIYQLEEQISNLENILNPFFQHDLKDLQSKLSPLDCAKLNTIIAYSVNTLFYMYLKTQGVSPTEHPVTEELNRVKQYIQKIRDITEEKQGPKIRINPEASKRVVAAGVRQVDFSKGDKTKKSLEESEGDKTKKRSLEKSEGDKTKKRSLEESDGDKTPKKSKVTGRGRFCTERGT